MKRSREVIKNLIKLADNIDEADEILAGEFATVEERYAFLQGLFTFEIIGGAGNEIEGDYRAALSAIVNSKWRA